MSHKYTFIDNVLRSPMAISVETKIIQNYSRWLITQKLTMFHVDVSFYLKLNIITLIFEIIFFLQTLRQY